MRMIPLSFLTHRWTGVVFGIACLIWIGSAMVLTLMPVGEVPTPAERLGALGPALAPADVAGIAPPLAQSDAGVRVQSATLHRHAGTLVWRAHLANGETVVLDALTLAPRAPLTPEQATAVAARAMGIPMSRHIGTSVVTEPNVIYFKRPVPAYRVSFDDAERTDVYMRMETGELTAVIARDERFYRLWGTMPHYSQFPPLDRIHFLNTGFRIVGLSAFMLSTISGMVYGLWLLLRRRRTQPAGSGGRRRQTVKTLIADVHIWLGIAVCAVLIAWIGSGYLLTLWPAQEPDPTAAELGRIEGDPAAHLAFTVPPQEALAAAVAVSDAAVMAVRARHYLNRPTYDMLHLDGTSTLVDGITGVAMNAPSEAMVREAAARFADGAPVIASIDRLDEYDTWYYAFANMQRANRRPLPVYRVVLKNEGVPSPIYLHGSTGELLARVDGPFRFFRWIGRGLHTFELPYFLEHPRQREAAVLIPSVLSVILSLTGLWLGVQYLGRRLRRSGNGGVRAGAPARQSAAGAADAVVSAARAAVRGTQVAAATAREASHGVRAARGAVSRATGPSR